MKDEDLKTLGTSKMEQMAIFFAEVILLSKGSLFIPNQELFHFSLKALKRLGTGKLDNKFTVYSGQIMHYDIIIIGSGMVGLALSRELKRKHPSLSILVIEKENKTGFTHLGGIVEFYMRGYIIHREASKLKYV